MITSEYVRQKMVDFSDKYPRYAWYFDELKDAYLSMLGATNESDYKYFSGVASGEKRIILHMIMEDSGWGEFQDTTSEMWDAIKDRHYEEEDEK